MDDNFFSGPGYTGPKTITQINFPTANTNSFEIATDEYMERRIDLNEQLVMNKPATFFFKMNSDSMEEAGINPGDLLIVDKSIPPSNGKIIIVAVDGELLIRRYRQGFNKQSLCAENRRYKNIDITEFTQFNAWGVVTCVIHLLDPALVAYTKGKKT